MGITGITAFPNFARNLRPLVMLAAFSERVLNELGKATRYCHRVRQLTAEFRRIIIQDGSSFVIKDALKVVFRDGSRRRSPRRSNSMRPWTFWTNPFPK